MIEENKTSKGFTLIELLMVISIISLLSSIILGYVGSARAKSRDTVRLNDMQQINTAAHMYYEDKNEVPDSIETLVNTGYLSAVPKDPSTGIVYSSRSMIAENGKKVFMASTTYETIKREDGENQNVGVIVSELTLEDICLLLILTDSFPNCSLGVISDQVVGMTKGKRSGDSGGITINGLEWQTNSSDLLCWSYMDWCSSLTPEGYGAREYCENLEYDGETDWRLPTINELADALNDQINGGSNPGGFYGYYWTSVAEGDQAYQFQSESPQVLLTSWGMLAKARCVR
jgi:prepilin-type N-terminal cleavage/methylation domain-containing protein